MRRAPASAYATSKPDGYTQLLALSSISIIPEADKLFGYLDTFTNLATGKAAMLYQGYGRGAGSIEKYAPKELANAEHFGVLVKPIGPSGWCSRTPSTRTRPSSS